MPCRQTLKPVSHNHQLQQGFWHNLRFDVEGQQVNILQGSRLQECKHNPPRTFGLLFSVSLLTLMTVLCGEEARTPVPHLGQKRWTNPPLLKV